MFTSSYHDVTNPRDIAFNQQGRVSPAQLAAYHSRNRPRGSQITIALVISLMTIGILAAEVLQTNIGHNGSWILILSFLILAVAGFVMLPAVLDYSQSVRIRQALADGRVDASEGEVVWKRGNFVAETPEGRLRSLFNDTLTLLPGRYRFYYLPGCMALLSADSLEGTGSRLPSASDVLTILASTHHFNPLSLESNRNGIQSPDQALRLTLLASLYIIGAIMALSISAGIIILFEKTANASAPVFPVLCLNIFLFIIGFYVLWRGFLIISDVWTGKIAAVQGHVSKSVWNGRLTSYHYSLAGMRWRVSHQAYNALVASIPYRIYFTPRSKILIAIEPTG